MGRAEWQSPREREQAAQPWNELMRRMDELVNVLARQAAALNGLELEPKPRAIERSDTEGARDSR